MFSREQVNSQSRRGNRNREVILSSEIPFAGSSLLVQGIAESAVSTSKVAWRRTLLTNGCKHQRRV
jgi:hypothetical protein